MKNYLFLMVAMAVSLTSYGQGKGKSKANKNKNKSSKVYQPQPGQTNTSTASWNYDRMIWGGTNYTPGKISKNQPAKVREAFARDYPYAGNVTWTKYRGDWTASFGSGIFGTKTAVYHANGARKDTRSVINRGQLPGNRSVWDQIFGRNNIATDQVVLIERPGTSDLIYRLLGNSAYYYFNRNGEAVNYNY